ncbi:MAG: hypothetical protein LAT64_13430 [Phycisphaerales bacterium]|nr:hypothetical protein [Planctomycetota bacterium]MCH8509757.1 hypothetical protein [Phycisphaerales bacterium]
MTTQELIEQTVLYSLGLLDEQDHDAYEAALAAATPQVRASVKSEAARMADLGDLLPDEQPSDELRELVIAAVRAGMREQEVEQRIRADAQKDTRDDAPQRHVAGRITPQTQRRHAQPPLARATRVHWLWRAAAIGLAGATVALTVISADVRDLRNTAAEGVRLAQFYDVAGAEFVNAALFDTNTRRVSLVSPADSNPTTAVASVWHNPDWSSARLFVKNLRPQENDKPYRLVVLDDQGNIVREVAEFRPNGEIQDFEININLSTESRLAIYDDVREAVRKQPVLFSVGSGL